MKLLFEIEKGTASLPSLSVITLRLIEMASDEDCSVGELVSLIEKDPALSIKLLTLANSAFYRGSQPVSSLQQAVIRIGFQRLRILALSLSLRDTFPMGKDGAMDFEAFWKNSLYRATLARAIAPRVKAPNEEEAFLSALILEIGLLIIWGSPFKEEISEALENIQSTEKLLEWERERWGTDHRIIGMKVLEKWQLPSHIIACQIHRSEDDIATLQPLEVAVHLAERIGAQIFQPAVHFNLIYKLAGKHASLDPAIMNDILISVLEEVEGTASTLSLELEKKKDILAILGKANSALSQISKVIGKCENLPSFKSLENKVQGTEPNLKFAMETIAHEIRNPLVSVCGFAKKLAATLNEQTDEGKYANVILKEALRLEKALDQLMEHAHGNQ